MPDSPLNLGTAGKAVARRLADGVRTVTGKGDDGCASCGARVPRPSGPLPGAGAAAPVTVPLYAGAIMADDDVSRLAEKIGRRLGGGGLAGA